MYVRRCLLLVVSVALSAIAAPEQDGIDLFESKIRPVLAARCYACHSAQAAAVQGGLRLDSADGLHRGGNSGPLIDRANPSASLLLRAISHRDKELKMPPGKPLPEDVVADFEAWARIGAPVPGSASAPVPIDSRRNHWSFQKPKAQSKTIDQFIGAALQSKGISPSPAAGKRTLMRRATYDLTGLPPSFDEVRQFLTDKDPASYERLVDRLLDSPQYGERWARHWLDVARYSDARNTGERFPWSYTYRDWVIDALNRDMPFDEFLTHQLAADRIPGNDPKNLAALGYISLGRDFPKSFPETVDDRIDVVTRGMLGLTVSCARCHDHKFDPIPTKDYYSLYSVFSNVREPIELPAIAAAAPKTPKDLMYENRLERIRKVDQEYRAKRHAEMVTFFKSHTADYLIAARDASKMSNTEVEEFVRERQLNLHVLNRWRKHLAESKRSGEPVFRLWHEISAIPDAGFATDWPAVLSKSQGANDRILAEFQTNPPTSASDAAAKYATLLSKIGGPSPADVPIHDFELIYTEGDGNNTRGFRRRFESMRAMYAYHGAPPRAMAIEDVPDPKPAHVFLRGNPNNPGVETPAGFLTCLSDGEPQAFQNGSGRLDLARAIASKDNPLTARVIVNRVWMGHFGHGLVRTPSDFGLRGEAPSHPELLDALAVRFMESGWSLKKLHREILLSEAYKRSSEDNPEARRIDPENQFLWRMNRRRLDIESFRDSVLAASGQLDRTIGGVPFALTAVPAVPRRTVYGYIERGRIPGLLSMFDFASPDQHAPERHTTTVPQQALFLLNSDFMTGQAKHLVQQVSAEEDPGRRIQTLYRRVLSRDPSSSEVAIGLRFLEAAPERNEPDSADSSPWHYGIGGKVLKPFKYFTGDAWQGASMLPDKDTGKAFLRATGGEPGDTPEQAVVLRWVSPVDGTVSIEGSLRHRQGDVSAGDGIRARIVSSRTGELASWMLNGIGADTNLAGLKVAKGEAIDFIVDGRDDGENDAFTWAPTIKTPDEQWSASAGFHGPAPQPLTSWERYAQVLLQTNEFAFLD
jgi:Protein of unknown function (DUF1553)/Protein of unknown function (DUF1549)/Planctomycete cytochrome C